MEGTAKVVVDSAFAAEDCIQGFQSSFPPLKDKIIFKERGYVKFNGTTI
jgi:hypothetical protein